MKKAVSLVCFITFLLTCTAISGTSQQKFMPDVKEFDFIGDVLKIPKITFPISIPGEGEISIYATWSGTSKELEISLFSSKDEMLLERKVGTSPIEFTFFVTDPLLKELGNHYKIIVSVQEGNAEGKIQISLPVRERVKVEYGRDLDKGELKTKKPEGLFKKGEAPKKEVKEFIKKPPQVPLESPKVQENQKMPAEKSIEVKSVTKKQKKLEKVEIEKKYIVLRMQILGEEVSVQSAETMEGPVVISSEVTGDIAYEVTDGERIYAVGTFPDPRYRRVYLPDGTSREAFVPDKPALFKVIIPEFELRKETLAELVVSLYSIPGELELKHINKMTFPIYKEKIKLLSKTVPGVVHKAMQIEKRREK